MRRLTVNLSPVLLLALMSLACSAPGQGTPGGNDSGSGPVAVSITPVQVVLPPGGRQTFTSSVTGTNDASVTWTATAGELDIAANVAGYTAPQATGGQTVTATSVADVRRTAAASITVVEPGGIGDPDAVLTPGSLASQPAGTSFTEPSFGTTLRRLTTASDEGGFATQEYSQLQAFSPDNSHILLIEDNLYTVLRLDDLSRVELDGTGWNAPRWHPTRVNTIIHYDSNEDTTLRVQLTDVETRATTTVYTFPPSYQRIRGNQSSDELSRDGRWIAGMASRADGDQVLFALDLDNAVLGTELAISDLYDGPCQEDPEWGAVEPDWVGVSPLGNYLVLQWTRDGTERCSGMETFDLQSGAFLGRPYDGHQHGDLGVLADGETEVFTTFEIYHPSGNLAVGYRVLPGSATVGDPVYLREMDWLGEHISCQGPYGVCLVTVLGIEEDGWSALEGELLLLYEDGSVLRLAHHRSSSCGYWVQPRATLSRDGRFVAFASDWSYGSGGTGCDSGSEFGNGDAYLIDLGGLP